MEIYLDHPHNGARVVYSPVAAAELEKTGWVIRKPKAEPIVEPVAEPVEAVEAPKAKKRGAK